MSSGCTNRCKSNGSGIRGAGKKRTPECGKNRKQTGEALLKNIELYAVAITVQLYDPKLYVGRHVKKQIIDGMRRGQKAGYLKNNKMHEIGNWKLTYPENYRFTSLWIPETGYEM